MRALSLSGKCRHWPSNFRRHYAPTTLRYMLKISVEVPKSHASLDKPNNLLLGSQHANYWVGAYALCIYFYRSYKFLISVAHPGPSSSATTAKPPVKGKKQGKDKFHRPFYDVLLKSLIIKYLTTHDVFLTFCPELINII